MQPEKPSIPKVPITILSRLLIFILIISASFTGGYFFGINGFYASIKGYPKVTIRREVPQDKTDLDFSLFWRVWDTLYSKYYDKTKLIESGLVYGAIRGMVAAVGDPYTVFLPPEENKVVQEDLQGNFDGIGIQIGFKGTQLVVMAPLSSSPAEKAGIKAGDYIIAIKDEKKGIDRGTQGITLPEAVQTIRGPKGTSVTLTLTREGEDEPFEKEITRANIDVPSVTVEYVGDQENIAHVKILKFAGETLEEWENTVVELVKKPNLNGIIVDVRNNPGGYLQGAVELASDFLEDGQVVVIEQDGDGSKQEFRVEKLGRLRKLKTVVLINGGSASASEIFAGALRDAKAVNLVGEVSFGKGTIQEPQQINGGAGLHITIARWLTPNGTWVNEGGLKPDSEVEDNPDTSEDEQLQKAIEIVRL
ncbi:hypothetical protein A2962_01950 [Candidatus Woesebacteria bacterium RIFCSPLOWO2_01_FULL_39_61]|uniref:PDZ domain-containing protein n=1 Tax=Candidatus Woesebacteria bacterium RIFCSPHIGHO2_02_FULL_39_13 TaxID=1802505 RepID=A0A1F7Z142_9BACT|nr:MAG: hypothetical protein A2692_02670 [Candidatus Woesebacteria bacterium RIFCSPHIGHO2_01_FULL_39_95]OGM33272.1 MAG: hypothetical protein A3D01_00590 [Candidatus Woesebacteria bacterium RIFCSPHIGHO2_02_FULL_39_13]OGM38444.1 MAG: hypothetical protein A3E13_00470 [Candidatus Woesebacteria bacterium RIFCSPHIGHO2_12_FULL_40_20]OGM66882.1 MAG: hypothetical protein A2962_01950 [Candidatus Woesebacteria bacterium RIFCSPLOWO2_01_FULL_39_61]OGM75321.1 MAG: hypothetical protein A3H19_02850 [Candidatus